MQRPDKKQVSFAISSISTADSRLQMIINQTENYKTTVRSAYENLKFESAKSTLADIPVEELNRDKSGIRVAALRSAGITNIGQLAGIHRQRLVAINGISVESADKILAKTNEICRNAASLIRVKIQPADKNPYTLAIVTSIYALMRVKNESNRAQDLYQQFHEPIQQNLTAAKQTNSFFKWMFAGENKKNTSVTAFQYLNNLVQQGFAAEVETLHTNVQRVAAQRDGQTAWTHFEQNAASYYAWLEEITGAASVENVTTTGLPEDLVNSINAFPLDTSLLKVVLRSYQVFGAKYALHQKRVLLGDEMGLGKTVQAIGAMAHLKAQGKTHFVVVCPVSVMINWIREIAQHSQMTAMKVHGDTRDADFAKWKAEGGIAVTTFETISKIDVSDLNQVDMLVVDEAHYVKNPEAIRTKALMQFAAKAEYILFMTGTPIENKVEEMIFLVGMLNQGVSLRIESLKALTQAPEFREAVAPVYLRRIRDDVLTELPDKLEKEEWCEMTPAEEKAYKEALLSESYMKIRQVSWNVDNIADSTKAKRLLEICEDAKEDGRKVIVFSFFLDTITKIQRLLETAGNSATTGGGYKCFGPINGSVSAEERQTIIDEFSKAEAGSVLVCQIIAAGTGLNIQAASVVVLCEPQWKPSTENQAISRVYRMGQVRNVLVHRLLSDETVDERILEVLKGKSEIFNNFADESVIGTSSLAGEEEQSGKNVKTVDENKAMSAIVQSELEKYGLQKSEVNNNDVNATV